MDLCRGQALEAELCGDLSCPVETYLTMIGLKTGALFRGACQAGARLGGGTQHQRRSISAFAEHLGLAFQMHDDLLPYVSDEYATGKSGFSDTVNARPTFPVLLGYGSGSARVRKGFESALSGRLPAVDAFWVLRDLVVSTGALDAARVEATAQAELAKKWLGELPQTPASAVLAAIADQSVNRDR